MKKVFSARKFRKILTNNGYELVHRKGSHEKYCNDKGKVIIVPVNTGTTVNKYIAGNIIKKHRLAI